MRLQKEDLINYCHTMARKTNGELSIIAIKSDLGFWKLVLVNHRTENEEILQGGMNLREAHEFLRAFYRGREFSREYRIEKE